MTTRLLLVRHGATLLSAEDRFSGATGVELSDEGRAQAERLAERLAHETMGAIYSSPLSRAADTARIDPARARLMLFNDVSHYQHQPRRTRGNLSKWWDAGEARDE